MLLEEFTRLLKKKKASQRKYRNIEMHLTTKDPGH